MKKTTNKYKRDMLITLDDIINKTDDKQNQETEDNEKT